MDTFDTSAVMADPSLASMPEVILGRIFQCFRAIEAPSLVALEKTCLSLKGALSSDSIWGQLWDHGRNNPTFQKPPDCENMPTWRERTLAAWSGRRIRQYQNRTDNLILETLGGAVGFRQLAQSLLEKMDPSTASSAHKLYLRGDTIAYLAEVLESYMVTKLSKALECAIFRSHGQNVVPVVHANDLAFVSKVQMGDDASHAYQKFSVHGQWVWSEDECYDVLGATAKRLLIRRLAFKAGVTKICSCGFVLAALDFLHVTALLLVDAFESSKGMAPSSIDTLKVEDPRYTTTDQDVLEDGYYDNFCPPFRADESGRIKCVIIPRQVKDAASRIGLKTVYLGGGWIASDGRTVEEEMEEAEAQYYKEDDDMSVET